jgi:hypothetical protein
MIYARRSYSNIHHFDLGSPNLPQALDQEIRMGLRDKLIETIQKSSGSYGESCKK